MLAAPQGTNLPVASEELIVVTPKELFSDLFGLKITSFGVTATPVLLNLKLLQLLIFNSVMTGYS